MSGEKVKAIFVQIIERPARKVLLLRGKKAEEYFEYCEEVGCEVHSFLSSVKEALYEPVGMWLPKHLIKPGTSKYVQGVEVSLDYSNVIPEGYELIELPPCTMMVFQGEPFEDEYFSEAVGEIWEHVKTFDPKLYGYDWDPEAAPRFQLAPHGLSGLHRGVSGEEAQITGFIARGPVVLPAPSSSPPEGAPAEAGEGEPEGCLHNNCPVE